MLSFHNALTRSFLLAVKGGSLGLDLHLISKRLGDRVGQQPASLDAPEDKPQYSFSRAGRSALCHELRIDVMKCDLEAMGCWKRWTLSRSLQRLPNSSSERNEVLTPLYAKKIIDS